MCAGQEVLIVVDIKNALIVGDLWEILEQQLKPHPVCLLNIIIIVLVIYEIVNNKWIILFL